MDMVINVIGVFGILFCIRSNMKMIFLNMNYAIKIYNGTKMTVAQKGDYGTNNFCHLAGLCKYKRLLCNSVNPGNFN